MTRVHIRTDDDVYRVDAVWLGPPRATFPWRARYSAYGVGLLVMIVIMFLQRRLGIDIGFFSVAWSLLITVVVTRFVSRRINDERPLLEWLTLFSHELRGPRPQTRSVGGALATGHVAVRRDPGRRAPLPRRARAGTTALPRAARHDQGHPAHPLAPVQAEPVAVPDARAPVAPVAPGARAGRRATADAHGFGPPSTADVGAPAPGGPPPAPRALPAAPAERSAAAIVASWGGQEHAEPVRVTARRVDRGNREARPGGAERAPGRGPRAFGPGSRQEHRSDGQEQEADGATPPDRR